MAAYIKHVILKKRVTYVYTCELLVSKTTCVSYSSSIRISQGI